jgi:uncharacterized protein (DUF1778 family)
MSKIISLRLDDRAANLIEKSCDKTGESIASFIKRAALERINEQQRDDAVIAEIKSLKKLIMDMAE